MSTESTAHRLMWEHLGMAAQYAPAAGVDFLEAMRAADALIGAAYTVDGERPPCAVVLNCEHEDREAARKAAANGA